MLNKINENLLNSTIVVLLSLTLISFFNIPMRTNIGMSMRFVLSEPHVTPYINVDRNIDDIYLNWLF